jgi:hypothetical protein
MQRIRICLFLDGEFAPLWACDLIRAIEADGHSEIVLAVMPPPPPAEPDQGPAKRPEKAFGQFVSAGVRTLLERCEAWLFERSNRVRDAFVPTSLAPLLERVPRLLVEPRRTRSCDYVEPADLERISAHDIDVGLRIGYRILHGDILDLPRFGIWSFHHGDNRIIRGGPPAFWEMMLGWRETGATLQILGQELDAGLVLARTRSSTMRWSLRDNASAIHWSALRLVPRKLAELRSLGGEAFMAGVAAANRDPTIYSRPLYGRPGNRLFGRLLLLKTMDKVHQIWVNCFWRDQWILLYSFSASLSLSLHGYRRLQPPADRLWADPQAIERDGRHYIFFEEMPFASNRGHIAVIELDRDGKASEPRRVLERPYHLSYPFLFEHEGTLYMIPESGENQTIELYRCAEFPHRWEFVHNVMEGVSAYDATMLHRDGRWWLFTTLVETEGASSWDELFVFFADSPLSREWTPHRRNPVVSDCRSARPAGPMFEHGGALYRPSQNSSGRYGRGFNLCRVDVLDGESYREEVVSQALPEWDDDVKATHTFSRSGDLHVIDAQVRRRRF